MKTIKIAPDFNEIKIKKNLVSVIFNGLRIEFTMIDTLDKDCHNTIKEQLRTAIALSSKSHQLKYLMEGIMTTDNKQLGTLAVFDSKTNLQII